MQASDFFTLPDDFPFRSFFQPDALPWEWVRQIGPALGQFAFGERAWPEGLPPGISIKGLVFIHPTVKLPPFAVIEGPAWIGPGCELRPGVYVRGNVIAGPGCVLGNSCEYKNSLLCGEVETAHFNYVGDSILGRKAHLGAGVICANLKLTRDEVSVVGPDGLRHATGLRKLGALVGDGAEVGCNSVLQPGAMLGRRSVVLTMPFHGYLPPNCIARPSITPRISPRPGK